MNEFLRLQYFLNYQWRAKTKYYLHSPFVYQFYLNVLEDSDDAALQAILVLREKLHSGNRTIEIKDMGAGGFTAQKISNLESKVAVRHKYGQLLYRLAQYFKPGEILELGTSAGLSSAYMALANSQCNVTSLEGSAALIELARKNHAELGIKNVTFIEGNFDETLPHLLAGKNSLGLVFFDGNHRKDSTLKYFNLCLEKATPDSIFIFDDIYWSSGMHAAWTEIKANPQITLAIDVFQLGICFFRKENLAKEEFVLRY